jgi:hypothetical protein
VLRSEGARGHAAERQLAGVDSGRVGKEFEHVARIITSMKELLI